MFVINRLTVSIVTDVVIHSSIGHRRMQDAVRQCFTFDQHGETKVQNLTDGERRLPLPTVISFSSIAVTKFILSTATSDAALKSVRQTRSQSDGQTGSGSASRWCSGSVCRRSELHDSVLVTVCNPWISEVCSHLIRYVTISVEFLISCRIWITGPHVFSYLQNIFLFFLSFNFCNRNIFQPFYESQLHHFYNSLSWAVFYQSLLKSIKLWGNDAIFVFLFFLSFFLWLLVAGDHGNLHFHYKKCRLNYLWAGFYLWLKNKYCMTQKWL